MLFWIGCLGLAIAVSYARVHDLVLPSSETEILGLDSSDEESLAVVTKNTVYIYSQPTQYSSPRDSLLGSIRLSSLLEKNTKLLEFKLLSKEHIFYCTSSICQLCTSNHRNFLCFNYTLRFENEIFREIISLAVVRADEKVYIRVVGIVGKEKLTRGAIIAFRPQEINSNTSVQYSLDSPFLSDRVFVAAYAHQTHAFFIDSSINNTHFHVILSRVCIEDRTKQLRSRIDLSLNCSSLTHEPVYVLSAHYNSRRKQLLVLFGKSGVETHHVCKYNMKEVNSYLDKIWGSCPNVSLINIGIVKSRYPFNGTLIARFNLAQSYPWKLLPGNRFNADTNAIFLATSNSIPPNIFRIRVVKNIRPTTYNPIVWEATSSLTSGRSITSSALGDVIFIANKTIVKSVEVSCKGLYENCESLMDRGYRDPLSCIWCSDENKMEVITTQEVQSCQRPLQTVCPPVLDIAKRSEISSDWLISGSGLDRMNNPVVYICDQQCTVNKIISSATMLQCSLADGSEQDSGCDVRLEGSLKHMSYSMLVDNPNRFKFMAYSSLWKAMLVIIIIAFILLILYGTWRFDQYKQLKNRGDLSHLVLPFPYTGSMKDNAYEEEKTSLTDPTFYEYDLKKTVRITGIKEIPWKQIRLHEDDQLGGGYFGVVYRATYTPKRRAPIEVACKQVNYQKNREHKPGETRELFREAKTMWKFDHDHLLRPIGIGYSEEKGAVIVLELMKTDLQKYIQDGNNKPTLKTLLVFEVQIALGMEHLHSHKFIHRDLAARNCMLDNKDQIKIADFGLCRQCTTSNQYEATENRALPFQWMAPEQLEHNQFLLKGDVWAYGVVLWEIMTRGMTPYSCSIKTPINREGVKQFLRSGNRLRMPPFCPPALYDKIMVRCWAEDPKKRPSFTELIEIVEDLIDTMEREKYAPLYTTYEVSSSSTSMTPHSENNDNTNGTVRH